MSAPEFAAMKPELVELRRDFHRHPELGFQEVRTSSVVADYLRGLGLEVQTGIAGTGVVALVKGARPGRTLLLRADLDALPIQEENDHDYRSENDGKMHACGHDGHTAIALVAAKLLSQRRDRLAGSVKMVFQPAEENPGGAKPMIDEGVMEDPRVDAALGLHLWNDLPLGTVGIRPGPLLAATDRIALTVTGRGGHAASPHQTVDPIVAAAHLVTALQSVVSRNVDPLKCAVLSITQFHAGTTDNVIPDVVRLGGTMRSFDAEVRDQLAQRLREMANQIAGAFGAAAEVEYVPNYPPTVSDPAMCDLVREAASQVVGAEGIVTPEPVMGGEDMAFFLERVPGCFFCVGAANAAEGKCFPHHNPRFDFDEDALVNGLEVMVRAAELYLARGGT